MLKLASWNVNSLKIRLDQVEAWLNADNADILALQETKLTDEFFPAASFAEWGWHVAFAGQKTYNGVAIISRQPLADIQTDIPNLTCPQRRILAATVGNVRIINLYVPNGSSLDSDKYQYKLSWLTHVSNFIREQLAQYTHVAVVGDFNIAPEDCDVHDPAAWQDSILVSPPERAAFTDLLANGLFDSFRCFPQKEQSFSWWDYRAAAFRRNLGVRIDHILLNHNLKEKCRASGIDVEPRRAERPSDHAPVWVHLEI